MRRSGSGSGWAAAFLRLARTVSLPFVSRAGGGAELTHFVRGEVPARHERHAERRVEARERAIEARVRRQVVAVVMDRLHRQHHAERGDPDNPGDAPAA